jgi:hypothetical protein
VVNVGFNSVGTLVTFDGENPARRWSPPLWGKVDESDASATNASSLLPSPPVDGRVTSPDGMLTVRLGTEASLGGEVVETPTNEVVADVRSSTERVRAAAFSPDGTWLAVADGTPTVRLHRWETIAPLARLQERSARMVGPMEPDRRAQLIPPTLWQRLVGRVAALTGR